MSAQDSNFKIQTATIEDVEALAKMLAYIENREVSPPAAIMRICAAQQIERVFLARRAGQAVGFALLRLAPSLSSSRPHAEVTELYLRENSLDQDLQRAFLEQLEKTARAEGATALYLHTGLGNLKAKNFYRAMGYRDYALALRKRLGDPPC